jgi:hypothetical protein
MTDILNNLNAYADQGDTVEAPESSDILGNLNTFQTRQEAQARTSVEKGLEMGPDKAAEVVDLNRKTGLEPSIIERNLEDIRKREQRKKLDVQRINRESPQTGALLRDPYKGAAAADDIDNLTGIEKAWNWYTEEYLGKFLGPLAGFAVEGGARLSLGSAGVLDTMTKSFEDPQQILSDTISYVTGAEKIDHTQMPGVGTSILELGDFIMKAVGVKDESAPALTPQSQIDVVEDWVSDVHSISDLTTENIVPFIVQEGARSAPEMVAAAFNPFIALLGSAGRVSQQRAKSNGRDKATLLDLLVSLPASAASVALDRLGARGMFGLNDDLARTGVKGVIGAAGKSTVIEGGTEGLQAIIEELGGTFLTDEGFSLGKAVDQALLEAVVGAGVGGGIRTVTATVESEGKIRRAEEHQQAIAALMNRTRESALRTRSPEAFNEFFQAVTERSGVDSVEVDVLPMVDFLRENGADPAKFFDDLGVDRDTVNKAYENGTDVSIKASSFISTLADSEYRDAALMNMRENPKALTMTEAQMRTEETQRRADQIATDVMTSIETQAVDLGAEYASKAAASGLYSPKESEQIGALLTSTYRTFAVDYEIAGVEFSQEIFDSLLPPEIRSVAFADRSAPVGEPQSEATLNQDIIDLDDAREAKKLQEFHGDLTERIMDGAREMAEKSAANDWKVEVGAKVMTPSGREKGQSPWTVVGRYIKEEGLSPDARPKEGIFTKAKDVPYLIVERDGEKTHLPEWAIETTFAGPRALEQTDTADVSTTLEEGAEYVPDNGLLLVHGSTRNDLTADQIEIVREGQKQGKKGRRYGGFYANTVEDLQFAEDYARASEGAPTVYDLIVKPGTRVLQKAGDITRLSEKDIAKWVEEGYGLVVGKDPRGRTEYVVIDPSAISSLTDRAGNNTAQQTNATPAPRQFSVPRGTRSVATSNSDAEIKAHASYDAAKSGDLDAAIQLVRDVVTEENINEARRFGDDVIYQPVIAEEAAGPNALPYATAGYYATETGNELGQGIVQSSRAFHTGARAMDRLLSRATFAGEVVQGGKYVLVDDVTVLGGTLTELANHIQANGGTVVGVVTLANASRTGKMNTNREHIRIVEERFGEIVRAELGLEPQSLSPDEAQFLAGFRNADALRDRITSAKGERAARLRAQGVSTELFQDEHLGLKRFYSKARQTVEAAKQGKATGQQWLGVLKGAGVKETEFDWIVGLREMLETVEGSITREELTAFIDQNGITLNEIVLGGAEGDTELDTLKAAMDEATENAVALENELADAIVEADPSTAGTALLYDIIADVRDVGEEAVDRAALGGGVYDIAAAYFQASNEMRDASEAFRDARDSSTDNDTKFANYTLPGGENHREFFITLPKITQSGEQELRGRFNIQQNDDGTTSLFREDNGEFLAQGDTVGDAVRKLQAAQEPGQSANNTVKDWLVPSAHRTGNREADNRLVVRIRVSDRIDSEGRRVLFIEEMQGDRQVEAKDSGYYLGDGAVDPEKMAAYEQKRAALERTVDDLETEYVVLKSGLRAALLKVDHLGYDGLNGAVRGIEQHASAYNRPHEPKWHEVWDVSDLTPEEVETVDLAIKARIELRSAKSELERLTPPRSASDKLPGNIPYDNANKYVELALKRMIVHAVENGYETVSWTPGQVQADRYSLDRDVAGISVVDIQSDRRTIDIELMGRDGLTSMDVNPEGVVTSANEANFEGKKLSEIVGDEIATRIMGFTEETTLEGDSLKVGGEGLKSLYNKIAVNTANKIGKKYGARVAVTTIPIDDPVQGDGVDTGLDVNDMNDDQLLDELGYDGTVQERGQKVWTLPVTEAMRNSVLNEGVTLYQGTGLGRLYNPVIKVIEDMKLPQWDKPPKRREGTNSGDPENMLPPTASGAAIWEKLSAKGTNFGAGVSKKEAIFNTGIEEYLTTFPDNEFTRADILAFLQQGGVVLDEVVKTEDDGKGAFDWETRTLDSATPDGSEEVNVRAEGIREDLDQDILTDPAALIEGLEDGTLNHYEEVYAPKILAKTAELLGMDTFNDFNTMVGSYQNETGEMRPGSVDDVMPDMFDENPLETLFRKTEEYDIRMREFIRERVEQYDRENYRVDLATGRNTGPTIKKELGSVLDEVIQEDAATQYDDDPMVSVYDSNTGLQAVSLPGDGFYFEGEYIGSDAPEAQGWLETHAYENGLVDEDNVRGGSARWHEHIVRGGSSNYREILLTLPENSGDPFVKDSHFTEENVVAFLRVTDRDMPVGEHLMPKEPTDDMVAPSTLYSEDNDSITFGELKAQIAQNPKWEVDEEDRFYNSATNFLTRLEERYGELFSSRPNDRRDLSFGLRSDQIAVQDMLKSAATMVASTKISEEDRVYAQEFVRRFTENQENTTREARLMRANRGYEQQRMKEVLKSIYAIDEFQSDWHQAGREYGYKLGMDVASLRENKGAAITEALRVAQGFDLDKVWTVLTLFQHTDFAGERVNDFAAYRADIEAASYGDADALVRSADLLHQAMVGKAVDNMVGFRSDEDRKAFFDAVKQLRNSDEQINDYFNRMEEAGAAQRQINIETSYDAATDVPFKGDSWLALGLKRAIIDAVENNRDAIAWPNSQTIVSSRWGSGARKLFVNQYDNKMPSLAETIMGVKARKYTVDDFERVPVMSVAQQKVKNEDGSKGKKYVVTSDMSDDVLGPFDTREEAEAAALGVTPFDEASVFQFKTADGFGEGSPIYAAIDKGLALAREMARLDVVKTELRNELNTLETLAVIMSGETRAEATRVKGEIIANSEELDLVRTDFQDTVKSINSIAEANGMPKHYEFQINLPFEGRRGLSTEAVVVNDKRRYGSTIHSSRGAGGQPAATNREFFDTLNDTIVDNERDSHFEKQNEQPEAWWVVDITPELKNLVLTTGLSQFQDGDQTGGRPGDQTGDQTPPPPRGSFDPQRNVINLFERANKSTLLHETGHMFVSMLERLSQRDDAPQRIKDNYAAMLNWVGATSADDLDLALNGDNARDKQEKLARAFEAYLMEGKAPSKELQSAFSQFKQWLLSVYASVRDLDIEIDDEIRSVFDRLLATDQEIAEMKTANEMDIASMKSIVDVMSAEERAAHAPLSAAADDAAENIRRIEEEKAQQRELEEWWSKELDAKREEAEDAINKRPEYRALFHLVNGTFPDGNVPANLANRRLDKAALMEMGYTQEDLNALPRGKRRIYTSDKETATDPTLLAAAYGFDTVEEMVRVFTGMMPLKDAVERDAGMMMRSEHGDPLNDGTMQRLTEEAMYNEERAGALRIELDALARKAGQQKIGRELMKVVVDRVFDETNIGELMTPMKFQQAAVRAARNAERAAAKGDWAKAFFHKRQHLLQHELFRRSLKARDEVTKINKRLSTLQNKKLDANKVDVETIAQLKNLLEFYQFGSKSETKMQADLAAQAMQFVERQRALGEDIILPGDLIEYVGEDANQQPKFAFKVKHWRKMTLTELRALRDMSNNLYKQGGEDKQREKEAIKERAEDLALGIDMSTRPRKGAKKKGQARAANEKLSDDANNWDFYYEHRKLESLLRQLDGFVDIGPMYQAIFKKIAKGRDNKVLMVQKIMQSMENTMKRYTLVERRNFRTDRSAVRIAALGGDTLNREQRLMIAANWGNVSSREALLEDGDFKQQYGDMWNEAAIEEILSTLNETDLDVVEDMWATVNQFWEDFEIDGETVKGIASLERAKTGVVPPKVEAEPFKVNGRTLSGGYFPLSYDGRLSSRVAIEKQADKIRTDQSGGFTSAQTRHGHTNARVGSGGRPVTLSIDVMTSHLEDVTHDLAFREAVEQADSLMRQSSLRDAIVRAIGQPGYDVMRDTLIQVAKGNRPQDMGGMGRVLRTARLNVTSAIMGGNVRSILTQPLGLAQSIERVGAHYVLWGLAEFWGNFGVVKKIHAENVFMRERGKMLTREIDDLANTIALPNVGNKIKEFGFKPMVLMDVYMVAYPTYLGAKRKAMAGKVKGVPGNNEAKAIEYAESVVRLTQGSGGAENMSMIQQRTEANKLITMFGSYFNSTMNMQSEAVEKAQLQGMQGKSIRGAGNLIWSTSMLSIIPAVMAGLLLEAWPDNDEDDPEIAWAKWLGLQLVNQFGAQLFLVRDGVAAATSGFDAGITPASSLFDAAADVAGEVMNIPEYLEEGEIGRQAAKSIARFIGYYKGIPGTSSVIRFFDTLYKQSEDEMKNEPRNDLEAAQQLFITGDQ